MPSGVEHHGGRYVHRPIDYLVVAASMPSGVEHPVTNEVTGCEAVVAVSMPDVAHLTAGADLIVEARRRRRERCSPGDYRAA